MFGMESGAEGFQAVRAETAVVFPLQFLKLIRGHINLIAPASRGAAASEWLAALLTS